MLSIFCLIRVIPFEYKNRTCTSTQLTTPAIVISYTTAPFFFTNLYVEHCISPLLLTIDSYIKLNTATLLTIDNYTPVDCRLYCIGLGIQSEGVGVVHSTSFHSMEAANRLLALQCLAVLTRRVSISTVRQFRHTYGRITELNSATTDNTPTRVSCANQNNVTLERFQETKSFFCRFK